MLIRNISNEKFKIEYVVLISDGFYKDKLNYHYKYYDDTFDMGIVISIDVFNQKNLNTKRFLIFNNNSSDLNSNRVILIDNYIYALLSNGELSKINLKNGKLETKYKTNICGMYFNLYKNFNGEIIVSGIYEVYSFDYDLNIKDKILCQNPIKEFYYDKNNILKVIDVNNVIYSCK